MNIYINDVDSLYICFFLTWYGQPTSTLVINILHLSYTFSFLILPSLQPEHVFLSMFLSSLSSSSATLESLKHSCYYDQFSSPLLPLHHIIFYSYRFSVIYPFSYSVLQSPQHLPLPFLELNYEIPPQSFYNILFFFIP